MDAVSRRGFVGALGMAGVMGAGAGLLGAAGRADATEAAAGETFGTTPAAIAALGGSTMSLAELNQKRRELVDSKGEYTCTDGTVVPAVWNKLRALVNTYGFGCGSDDADTNFDFFRMLFNDSEDEAQAFIEMPYGVMFTAADFATQSGRDEDACIEVCESLADRGILWRARRAGVAYYHHAAVAHGMFEYNLDHFADEGWLGAFGTVFSGDYLEGYVNAGTPFYYAIPVGQDVVADEQILLQDDWMKIIARNETIAVSPCQCRLSGEIGAGVDVPAIGTDELKEHMATCGHPLETCISTGEEAAYYIEKGIGRQVTQEEAVQILQRSVDAGMVVQSAFTKDSEIICSCHGDCCGILKTYQAIGPEGCAEASSFPNNSHYNLEYDKDACLKCGACAERCPMFAITMDADDYPEVDARCMRCGQCGLVCPVNARTLTAKAADEMIEKPSTLLEDYNLQAMYRFDHEAIR